MGKRLIEAREKAKGKRYSHRPKRVNSEYLIRINNKWYMDKKEDDTK